MLRHFGSEICKEKMQRAIQSHWELLTFVLHSVRQSKCRKFGSPSFFGGMVLSTSRDRLCWILLTLGSTTSHIASPSEKQIQWPFATKFCQNFIIFDFQSHLIWLIFMNGDLHCCSLFLYGEEFRLGSSEAELPNARFHLSMELRCGMKLGTMTYSFTAVMFGTGMGVLMALESCSVARPAEKNVELFTTRSRLVHDLFTTCSRLVRWGLSWRYRLRSLVGPRSRAQRHWDDPQAPQTLNFITIEARGIPILDCN